MLLNSACPHRRPHHTITARRLRLPGGLLLGLTLPHERRRRGQAVRVGLEEHQGAEGGQRAGGAVAGGRAAGAWWCWRRVLSQEPAPCQHQRWAGWQDCALQPAGQRLMPCTPPVLHHRGAAADCAQHEVPRPGADRLRVAPHRDLQGGHLLLGRHDKVLGLRRRPQPLGPRAVLQRLSSPCITRVFALILVTPLSRSRLCRCSLLTPDSADSHSPSCNSTAAASHCTTFRINTSARTRGGLLEGAALAVAAPTLLPLLLAARPAAAWAPPRRPKAAPRGGQARWQQGGMRWAAGPLLPLPGLQAGPGATGPPAAWRPCWALRTAGRT